MKYQVVFSLKKMKMYFKNVICGSRDMRFKCWPREGAEIKKMELLLKKMVSITLIQLQF